MTLRSLIFYLIESPITILLSLIFQTFLTCCFLKLILRTSWFSLILFLIFIGGLIIIFLYITRLAANNLIINLNTIYHILFLLAFRTISIYMLFNTRHATVYQENLNITNLIFKIYSSLNQFMIITIIIYLLLVLLICVNIILTNRGPLRALKPSYNP